MDRLAKKIGKKIYALATGAALACGRRKKLLAALLVAFSIILILAPMYARAGWTDIFTKGTVQSFSDALNDFIGWAIYKILYLVALIGAVAIAIIMYFVQIVLEINNHVQDGVAVQSGFSVTLSIANLGFVLGIIVVALATILRSQTYGIKQILWKLVVAAILVNFGLVIAGAILGFANQFTYYFMTAIPVPGGGSGVTNFAAALAGAFNPQKTFLSFNPDATVVAGGSNSGFNTAAAAGGQLADLLTPVLNLAFIIFFLIAIVITLAVFLVMLIVRYLYLGILMILMPLAWVAWIFPKFSHHWTKWWNTFLRWTFFAPLVIFFLYLAIMTAQVMSNPTNATSPDNPLSPASALINNSPSSNALIAGIDNFIHGFASTVMPMFMQMLMIIGLAVGGMVAANSLSITGAGVAIGAMTSVGRAAQGYVGKQGRKAVSAAVPTGVKERLQAGEIGALGRVPGMRRLASLAGRGLGKVEKAGGADLVDKEAGWAREQAKDKNAAARLLAGSLNREQQLALTKQMYMQGDLDDVKTINGVPRNDFLENEKLFEDYGQARLFKDANKATGSTPQSRKAGRAIGAEVAKKQPQIDILDKQIQTYEEQAKKVEAAKINAQRELAKNPNAVVTDTDGAVTGIAGNKVKAAEFIDSATRRYETVTDIKKRQEDVKEKVLSEAAKAATVADEKGMLGVKGAKVNAKKLQEKETEDLVVNKMKPDDYDKLLVNEIWGKGPRGGSDAATADSLARAFTEQLAKHAPQFVGHLMPGMKASVLDSFVPLYRKMLTELEEIAKASKDEAQLGSIEKKRDAFERSVAYNMSRVGGYGGYKGTEREEEKPGPAAAAAPPPPPSGGGK